MNHLFDLKIKNLLLFFLVLPLFAVVGYLIGTEKYLWAGLIVGALLTALIFIKLLENPFLGILGITFFLPFERLPTIEIGGNTLKISYILTILTFFAWLISGLAKRELKIKMGYPAVIAIIFLVISLLSIYNSPNLTRSFTVLAVVTLVVLAFLLFINLVDTKEKLQTVIKTLLISTVVVLSYGFYQYLGDIAGLAPEITGISIRYSHLVFGFPRFQSVGLEPLYFANFLLLPAGVLIGLIAGNLGTRNGKLLFFVLLFFAVLAMFLTVSRGGYVGIGVMFLLFLVVRFKTIFTPRVINITLRITLLLLLSSVLFFNLTSLGNKAFIEIRNHLAFYSQRGSITERLGAYNLAFKEWKKHPFLGNGIGSFGPATAFVPQQMPKGGWAIVNNEYLEILTEQGVVGLGVFLWFIIVVFYKAIAVYLYSKEQYLKFVTFGLILALVGILVQYNLFSTLYIIHFWVLLALILVSTEINREKPQPS